MKYLLLLFSLFVGATAACAQADTEVPDAKEQYVPAELDGDGKAIVSGMNGFGLELYGRVRDGRGDLAISPASVSTAFGLAFAGAKGRAGEEIASVLHYPAVPDFHRSFGGLLRTMDLGQNGRTLSVNNAIWLQDGLRVRPEYVDLVRRDYGAGLQFVDYRVDPDAARAKINAWVEAKTNNRIRNLLGKENVSQRTRSVLVNTIYFKADWADPFDKAATKEKAFTTPSGKKRRRPIMSRRMDVSYSENLGVKAIAIPYRGHETEMVFLLPDRPNGLAALERSLTGEALAGWLAKLNRRAGPVDVSIPKFRIEKRLELSDTLRQMGMETAFSNDSDFSGLKAVDWASSNQEDWNLKLGNVIHQVFVEVEEKGTEATAATAIEAVVITGRRAVEPKVFKADHPFLFLIRDRRTDAILFIGRYSGESA